MSKWTWPALAALLAAAGGTYYLLSQRQVRSATSESLDLNVEEFGDDDGGDEGGDNTYEMLEDEALNSSKATTTAPPQADVDQGLKIDDDEDDLGQAGKDAAIIDDEEDEPDDLPKK